ncbi:SET domain protein, putative [Babesia caballi]|uniref:SET domain protein, putative n=1 Tax=Babesia caballi TaxID=5871 RepID=A0AAV4LZ52_BABCB|nr:SET domain protein, putative [Babesia caballi]
MALQPLNTNTPEFECASDSPANWVDAEGEGECEGEGCADGEQPPGLVFGDDTPSPLSESQLEDGDDLDVCVEVKPLGKVFYNTVRDLDRGSTLGNNEFEQDLRRRDPTQVFPKSARGFSGMLQRSFYGTHRSQRLIWMVARYEAICQRLQEGGNSLTRIRTGNANMTRQQLLQLFNDEREKLFGSSDFFPIGEPYLGMAPFTYFFKREELLYFGICQSPYETVSVAKMRDGTEIAQAIILDGNPSLREDLGTRFILYAKFEKGGNELNDYTDKHQPIFESWIHEVPIRVVRGYNAISRYAPIWGFRYDGLYRIIGVYSDNNKQGLRVWSYVFSACNPQLEPPVFLQTEEGSEMVNTTDNELKSVFINHAHIHAKFQKSIKKKLAEDLRQVDVVYKGKKLFTIGVPHLLRPRGKQDNKRPPLVVNFAIIYRYIRRLCKVTKVGQEWLDGPVAVYEKARQSGSKIWWARGGFLPLKLIIQYLEPRRWLTMEINKGQFKEKVISKKVRHQKAVVINRELAKTMARPFFPQSDTDSIWTYIELAEPMPPTWNPYEDISAGSEVHPIPVVNTVDDEEPPMVFTYIRSNIFFSRLPHLNFDPVCAGCIPEALDKEAAQTVAVKGFCKGLLDDQGRIYCQGVNKGYLATIQSRAACSDNCPCSVNCSNRLLEGVQVPVKLVKTTNMGWALHGLVPIPMGTYVMQYVGEVVCRSEMIAREHLGDGDGARRLADALHGLDGAGEHRALPQPLLRSQRGGHHGVAGRRLPVHRSVRAAGHRGGGGADVLLRLAVQEHPVPVRRAELQGSYREHMTRRAGRGGGEETHANNIENHCCARQLEYSELSVRLNGDVSVHEARQLLDGALAVEGNGLGAAGVDEQHSGVGVPLNVVQGGLVAVAVEQSDGDAAAGAHGLAEGGESRHELLAVLAEGRVNHEQNGLGGVLDKVRKRVADESDDGAVVGGGRLLTLDAARNTASLDVGVEPENSLDVVEGVDLGSENVATVGALVSDRGEGLNGEGLLGSSELLHVEPGEEHRGAESTSNLGEGGAVLLKVGAEGAEPGNGLTGAEVANVVGVANLGEERKALLLHELDEVSGSGAAEVELVVALVDHVDGLLAAGDGVEGGVVAVDVGDGLELLHELVLGAVTDGNKGDVGVLGDIGDARNVDDGRQENGLAPANDALGLASAGVVAGSALAEELEGRVPLNAELLGDGGGGVAVQLGQDDLGALLSELLGSLLVLGGERLAVHTPEATCARGEADLPGGVELDQHGVVLRHVAVDVLLRQLDHGLGALLGGAVGGSEGDAGHGEKKRKRREEVHRCNWRAKCG